MFRYTQIFLVLRLAMFLQLFLFFSSSEPMDVGDATSTTSMDVVKVGLENQVGLE